MKTIHSLITALALVSVANAQETKRPIPDAQHLMERAKQAKEAGRYEEAKELAEQARKIGGAHREAHGKKGMDERLAHARREIEELQRAGKHEEAAQLKRRVAGAMHPEKAPPQKEATEGPARLRHVMEAIRHLREAGLKEPAEGLEKLAHQLREELEHHQKTAQAPKADKPPHPPGGDLQAMREQLQKMSHAIEDLRREVGALKGGEPHKPRQP